jgi:hypothetical protein
VEHAWRAFGAVHGRENCEADLVDETSAEKRPVGVAGGNGVPVEARRVDIRDPFRQHVNDRIADDTGAFPGGCPDSSAGLPVEQLLPQIAEHLPQLGDGMTPNGKVSSGGSLLDAGPSFLSFLNSRMA